MFAPNIEYDIDKPILFSWAFQMGVYTNLLFKVQSFQMSHMTLPKSMNMIMLLEGELSK